MMFWALGHGDGTFHTFTSIPTYKNYNGVSNLSREIFHRSRCGDITRFKPRIDRSMVCVKTGVNLRLRSGMICCKYK
jgi:hypothetical protein